MAFIKGNLIALGAVGGPDALKQQKIHWYSTNDTAAVVEATGYFDDACVDSAVSADTGVGQIQVDDIIQALVDKDGTPQFKIYRVVDATPGSSDVVSMKAGADDCVA